MTQLRRKILILAGATVVVVGVALFFVLLPLQQSVSTAHSNLTQERVAREIANLREQDLQATQREYERLQTSTEELRDYAVTTDTVLAFISTLEKLAANSGVQQELQNFQAPTGGATSTVFSIILSGSFPKLLDYLSSLQKIDTIVGIEEMTFSRSENADDGVDLTLRVHLPWQ